MEAISFCVGVRHKRYSGQRDKSSYENSFFCSLNKLKKGIVVES